MINRTARTIFSRVFRSVGYITLLFDWLFVIALTLPAVIKSGVLNGLINPQPVKSSTQVHPLEMNPLLWGFVAVVTIFMIAISIYALLRVPAVIASKGDKIVTHTAKAVVPVITHHRPLPVKRRREIQARTVLALQIVAAVLPFICSYFAPVSVELTRDIVVTVAAVLSVMAVACFLVSWLVRPHSSTTSQTRSHASHESR